jgi:2-methylcitrate dehydratase PrpD
MTDPAAALAAHVANTRFQDLPPATVAATRRDLQDTLGCALGGSGAPGIAQLLRLYQGWGGAGQAGLLLVGGRLPAPQAAYIHGAMAHALDYDDTYDRGCSIHPGASILGTALATADLLGTVSGQDLVLAATLGLDVSNRIALAAKVDRGWHRTSAIGVFGATAVAAKLLKLSAEQIHHAFGIALSQASGSRQCIIDGALTKRLQAGHAASAGLLSALLASDGFTGGDGIFAGRFGFLELYQPGGYDIGPLTEELGQAWRGDEVSFKPYPCGRPLHAAIDVSVALHDRLDLTAGTIGEVIVTGDPRFIADYFNGAPGKRRPTQIVEAQFALPFLIANGLLHGRVGIDQVANFVDPDVLALAARIQGEAGGPKTEIKVRRTDGRSASQSIAMPLGAPENPLSEAQQIAKFRDCAAHAVRPIPSETIEQVLTTLATFDEVADARSLIRLLA